SHLHAVKRIFRYLKGKPHLGLWYPKDSPFDLVAYSDSDYAGASLDRKSKTGGCQILGCRLISWQCKKQTVIATSSTKAEYVAAASCCAQVLWIQNQLLDYGTKMPMAVPISTREPKCTVNQSVATPLRRTVALESTNQKPRHTTKKLYEHVTKTFSWWYPKFTPPEYKWKPKSQIGNVNPNVSMPLGNVSRTTNILEPMTPRCSTVSNTPLYSNSFAARRDNSIHLIEFDDSYKAPPEEIGKGPASESSAKKKGRTIAITSEDMQKRRNDVKARTTLLLALTDEHQLRFSKYETAKELWEAILKTFSGNEAAKKTKKNQLKMQYGNFKNEGSETLEQTFNRLQAIMSHLEFMDVEIEQDDLNQKFLTSLAPEWLMYTIVWRNRDDLDTMSLDDVYNHLKDYKPEVQKKSESNSQNIVFISSSNTNNGKAASLSHDTVCAYIATQSNGSYIKYEDMTQIDEDDIEEMDIKWNMALLSMRVDRF
nr:uncharacterized mitochondrial protein AtMg00810-like [Tanacetum cinerariifolium]